TWGPPPLKEMTRLFFEMNANDINVRIADEGRVPLVPLVHVHEIHGAGRVIVISGDTTPSDNLIQLAQGADVLVHEALYVPGIDRLVARVPNASALRQSILSHHTSAEDAGRV